MDDDNGLIGWLIGVLIVIIIAYFVLMITCTIGVAIGAGISLRNYALSFAGNIKPRELDEEALAVDQA